MLQYALSRTLSPALVAVPDAAARQRNVAAKLHEFYALSAPPDLAAEVILRVVKSRKRRS